VSFYVPKARVQDDYVADADDLQVEFQRAEDALQNLDQNNIAASTLTASPFAKPSASDRAAAYAHDGGNLLLAQATIASSVTWGSDASDDEWQDFEDDNGQFVLTFTNVVPATMDFFGNVQYRATGLSSQPSIVDMRLLLDGATIGVTTKTGAAAAAGDEDFAVHVEGRGVLVPPGVHTLSLQGREREVHGGVFDAGILIGFGENRA